MASWTQAEFEAFAPLSIVDDLPDAVEADVVAQIQEASDAEVDSYYLIRYPSPYPTPVAAAAKTDSLKIAVWLFACKFDLTSDKARETARQMYLDAISHCEDIRDGKGIIPSDSSGNDGTRRFADNRNSIPDKLRHTNVSGPGALQMNRFTIGYDRSS